MYWDENLILMVKERRKDLLRASENARLIREVSDSRRSQKWRRFVRSGLLSVQAYLAKQIVGALWGRSQPPASKVTNKVYANQRLQVRCASPANRSQACALPGSDGF